MTNYTTFAPGEEPEGGDNQEPDYSVLDDLDGKERTGGRKLRAFWREVGTLGRMARAVKRGEYELATPQILAVLATLGYVVSPVDAVPDIVPMFGLMDDAGVVALLVGSMAYEIACYRDWEANGGGLGRVA